MQSRIRSRYYAVRAWRRSVDWEAWVFTDNVWRGLSRMVIVGAMAVGSVWGVINLGILISRQWGVIAVQIAAAIAVAGWILWAVHGPVPKVKE